MLSTQVALRLLCNKTQVNVMNRNQNRSSWRIIEPNDNAYSVKHQVTAQRVINRFSIIGASVRGKKHAHFGEWRDDSFAVTQSGQWTILTVADGAGSAPLSRFGSNIATSVVKKTLKKLLFELETILDNSEDYQTDNLLDSASDFLRNAFIKVIQAIQTESEKLQCSISNLATTLLTVLHIRYQGEDLFIWAYVGDCVFAVFPTSETCEVLCDEDHGTSGGETRFITSSGIQDTLGSRVHFKIYKDPVHSFALMTDGVSDDLYPLQDRLCGLVDGDVVGKGYMTDVKVKPLKGIRHYLKYDKNDARKLSEWLQYNKTGSTYDDRTLIVALNNN